MKVSCPYCGHVFTLDVPPGTDGDTECPACDFCFSFLPDGSACAEDYERAAHESAMEDSGYDYLQETGDHE